MKIASSQGIEVKHLQQKQSQKEDDKQQKPLKKKNSFLSWVKCSRKQAEKFNVQTKNSLLRENQLQENQKKKAHSARGELIKQEKPPSSQKNTLNQLPQDKQKQDNIEISQSPVKQKNNEVEDEEEFKRQFRRELMTSESAHGKLSYRLLLKMEKFFDHYKLKDPKEKQKILNHLHFHKNPNSIEKPSFAQEGPFKDDPEQVTKDKFWTTLFSKNEILYQLKTPKQLLKTTQSDLQFDDPSKIDAMLAEEIQGKINKVKIIQIREKIKSQQQKIAAKKEQMEEKKIEFEEKLNKREKKDKNNMDSATSTFAFQNKDSTDDDFISKLTVQREVEFHEEKQRRLKKERVLASENIGAFGQINNYEDLQKQKPAIKKLYEKLFPSKETKSVLIKNEESIEMISEDRTINKIRPKTAVSISKSKIFHEHTTMRTESSEKKKENTSIQDNSLFLLERAKNLNSNLTNYSEDIQRQSGTALFLSSPSQSFIPKSISNRRINQKITSEGGKQSEESFLHQQQQLSPLIESSRPYLLQTSSIQRIQPILQHHSLQSLSMTENIPHRISEFPIKDLEGNHASVQSLSEKQQFELNENDLEIVKENIKKGVNQQTHNPLLQKQYQTFYKLSAVPYMTSDESPDKQTQTYAESLTEVCYHPFSNIKDLDDIISENKQMQPQFITKPITSAQESLSNLKRVSSAQFFKNNSRKISESLNQKSSVNFTKKIPVSSSSSNLIIVAKHFEDPSCVWNFQVTDRKSSADLKKNMNKIMEASYRSKESKPVINESNNSNNEILLKLVASSKKLNSSKPHFKSQNNYFRQVEESLSPEGKTAFDQSSQIQQQARRLGLIELRKQKRDVKNIIKFAQKSLIFKPIEEKIIQFKFPPHPQQVPNSQKG